MKGQTTVEYALALVMMIFISAAFHIFTDESTSVQGRHVFGLMYEQMERAVSRAYP